MYELIELMLFITVLISILTDFQNSIQGSKMAIIPNLHFLYHIGQQEIFQSSTHNTIKFGNVLCYVMFFYVIN